MQKLKVGIIGTGMAFERLHYPAFSSLAEQYAITALCDIDKQKALNWAGKLNINEANVYTDYREMIKKANLDLVDIMVPIELNYEVTEQVASEWANQRKGIICEKPLAPTLNQAIHARVLAKKYGIPVMIAENCRYSQEADFIRDLVRTNKVGDIYYFILNSVTDFPRDMLGDKFPATEWRQHPEYPGGAITDMAIHDVAEMQHIFGGVAKVHAFGRPQNESFSPYSVVNVNLEFENGVTGQYSFFCAGQDAQRPLTGLRVFGTDGMIYLEERDAGVINVAYNDGRSEQFPYEVQKGFYNELLNFYNSFTGLEQISVTPEMEFGDLRVCMCILDSIKQQKVVTIEGDMPLHYLGGNGEIHPDEIFSRGNLV
ncbi:MAG: Gfo/Idh/MocA family oxidoreductase [Bacillota bacterium]|nr:Gfo/Idh/MocA family oxidoreductase [Bacillota bacterium]MDW7685306.1 Gfo/Idh/MocA family oxidoreductase [Bacillota bacterium]